MYSLAHTVSLVTGGANGIGADAVRQLLRQGAKFVAFLDVDETSGVLLEEELSSKHGKEKAKFFKCDVTNDKELFDVFDYTMKNHGYIDLVVNNAGIGNDRIHKKEIEVNFTSLVTSSLKALEIMRKDKGGKGGTIINISSIGALTLQKDPTIFVYCATKSAILMFSKNMGVESYYAYTGVRVITICFGLTTTDIIPNVKGIDDLTTKGIRDLFGSQIPQTSEKAAEGIIEAYKKGKTGSVWLIIESKMTDITERVEKAYRTMIGTEN